MSEAFVVVWFSMALFSVVGIILVGVSVVTDTLD